MTRGMIVAPQPEAVEAGAMVLKEGGNAIDAGIACAFVQGVVDPQMTGIAGFGSLQAYLPGLGVHKCIDFHGKSPRATRPDMWEDLIEGEARDGFGFILKGNVNDLGYQSVTVPGSLKAYAEAHEAWGRACHGRRFWLQPSHTPGRGLWSGLTCTTGGPTTSGLAGQAPRSD